MLDADYDLARGLLEGLLHWRRDAVAGRPSRVLSRVLGEGGRAGPEERGRLAREIYYGGHAAAVLEEATAALDRAMQRASSVRRAAEIAMMRRHCDSARTDLAAIMEHNRALPAPRPALALPPRTGDRILDLAADAAAAVVAQWRLGFGEVSHHTRISPATPREIVRGDIFQRALIADALSDLPAPWPSALAPMLSEELAYLHEARRCPLRGWSYYPTLDELPPDADTLGQILQMTLRLGRRDLVPSFDEPIRQAVSVGALGDGSFATWMVPPPGERSALHARQAALVGPPSADPEVVANLGYAMAMLDRDRYSHELASAARWVAARQKSGAWTATWYLGSAYATYVCARLLAAQRGFPMALDLARRTLLDGQRSDGGWGRKGETASNALDTALALLALDAIGGSAAVEPVLGRALDYLAGFAPDRWPAVPFIRHSNDDARPLASRTITAAYVAKACARCAVH